MWLSSFSNRTVTCGFQIALKDINEWFSGFSNRTITCGFQVSPLGNEHVWYLLKVYQKSIKNSSPTQRAALTQQISVAHYEMANKTMDSLMKTTSTHRNRVTKWPTKTMFISGWK
ncbi:hypothetical protein CEXT_542931 [Caerostris extrusa]|uniref:LAGLIDADG homing endonuclease n=1 Tax=Caerostris extrusa TaxID=172846 RepID=A0AAV4NN49_CAEEX|nr:hypothetical protein CEXT_542931 [Caerostris extrusa]